MIDGDFANEVSGIVTGTVVVRENGEEEKRKRRRQRKGSSG